MNKKIFHILAVDDDDRIRELVKEYLVKNNFLVTTAKDSMDAKQKLEIVKFDILILDIMMPGEDGLSLTKEIKKNDPIPVILLTAKGETHDRIEGLELGADDYLGKPFEPKELLLRIKNILNKIQKPILSDKIYVGSTLVNLKKLNIKPVYKRVDTCAAEFETSTAYLYSTYEEECESLPTDRKKILILGSGPNRIGQGIEFDYCCVHASYAIAECGYESIMINCNPETVSTDYDTSDRLYFEPLTFEDVMAVIDKEKPSGIIIQFGGQTPLKLARQLLEAGAPIIGTSPDSIDLAEDRERFKELVESLDYLQPFNEVANNPTEAIEKARKVKYPLVVRPSYVLGGRAMEIVYNDEELKRYMDAAVKVSNKSPVLLDHFLDKAIEVDVDAVSDGKEVFIGAIMEHIEQAGVHSGDSSCSIPPMSLSNKIQKEIKKQMIVLAKSLNVIGLVNAQFAIQKGKIFILEVNPRAARTVPFVSKATGKQLAKIAAKTMIGISLKEQRVKSESSHEFFAVKGPVFPFNKFPDSDPILGPEMKSTGEVMGTGSSFGEAYIKSQHAAGIKIPRTGTVFLSVRDPDKTEVFLNLARLLIKKDFKIIATEGTSDFLTRHNINSSYINKVHQGQPHIVDLIREGAIDLIINTTEGKQSIEESFSIRAEAVIRDVTYYTSLEASVATMDAFDYFSMVSVNRLQDYY